MCQGSQWVCCNFLVRGCARDLVLRAWLLGLLPGWRIARACHGVRNLSLRDGGGVGWLVGFLVLWLGSGSLGLGGLLLLSLRRLLRGGCGILGLVGWLVLMLIEGW